MNEHNSKPDIACTLTDEEFRERRTFVRSSIKGHVISVERIADRVIARFPETADIRQTVDAFVALERRCCGFLQFHVAPPAEHLVLTITGPKDAEKALDLFAGALTEARVSP